MRKYYVHPEDVENYVNDMQHRAISWTENGYYIKIKNDTDSTLRVDNGRYHYIKPQETLELYTSERYKYLVQVDIKDTKYTATFEMFRGFMIARRIPSRKSFLQPVFKNGVVNIKKARKLNLGKKKYEIAEIKDLKTKKVTLTNNTHYDLTFMCMGKVFCLIKSLETAEVDVPLYSNIYVDTETEEILYHDKYCEDEDRILRVNGLILYQGKDNLESYNTIFGPGNSEPYIRYLYFSDYENKYAIYCNDIDDSID